MSKNLLLINLVPNSFLSLDKIKLLLTIIFFGNSKKFLNLNFMFVIESTYTCD